MISEPQNELVFAEHSAFSANSSQMTPDHVDLDSQSEAGALPARQGRWLPWLAALVTVLSLVLPSLNAGIWEPAELSVAEFARRIALNLYSAPQLALSSADNSLPIRAELARGELPFTSFAVGLKLFGMHAWAARIPLLVWALVGAGALYCLLRRLAGQKAASFALLALASMPLYFMHARTLLGEGVTMAALAIALCGLVLAVFERNSAGGQRCAWFILGLAGLLAGLLCRGLWIGVSVPTLAVGTSWLFFRKRLDPRFTTQIWGAACLVVGAAATLWGGLSMSHALEAGKFSLWVGTAFTSAKVLPAFDVYLAQLGHGLFPWSALVPVAFAYFPDDTEQDVSQWGLWSSLAISAVLALLVLGLCAPSMGVISFSATPALAGILGLFFARLEQSRGVARWLPLVCVAALLLFAADFLNLPEKSLTFLGVAEPHIPDSFALAHRTFLLAATGVACAALLGFWLDADADGTLSAEPYRAYFRALGEVWDGNLQFSLLVLQTGLMMLAVAKLLSDRYLHLAQFENMSALGRMLGNLGVLVLPLGVLLPPLAYVVRDAVRFMFRAWDRAGAFMPRARTAALGLMLSGMILSLGYYPQLLAQLAPKTALDSYGRRAKAGQELGMVGKNAASASYQAGVAITLLPNVPESLNWLMAGDARRWLLVKSNDLAVLNALFRSKNNAQNLPVLDAESSEIFLVSNRLEPAERNQNPFERWLPNKPPEPSPLFHPLSATLGGVLDVLGWDVQTTSGAKVGEVEAGKKYELSIYYKVVAPVTGNWETFVHIDGFQRRFNADHLTLEGKYAFNLWHVGDYVVDRTSLTLEPNFTPGNYQLYFGLFIGSKRLEVTRGKQDDMRVEAGPLLVR